jgi:hypothetical protein
VKVLVAGASGALGVPLTRQLIADGHKVLGLTRDPAGARRLEALGAEPVVADALDRDGLVRAVDGLWADAVIHELTALRKPPTRHAGMAPTDRLRTEGTTNLLAAAEALGARRFLTQATSPRSRPCWPGVACPSPRGCPGLDPPHRRGRGHGGGARARPARAAYNLVDDLPASWGVHTTMAQALGTPHRPAGSPAGCCGWPPPTSPRSPSTPRCASPTPRPGPSSAGSRRSPPTTTASGPWPPPPDPEHASIR